MTEQVYRRDMTVHQSTLLLVSTAVNALLIALAVTVVCFLFGLFLDLHARVYILAWATLVLVGVSGYVGYVRTRLESA